ncbi:MAG: Outer rane receptor for ferrienterochelin and colicin [Acidobacteriaceae bacterium]|nr:Outer rane receptor for ferrienterochelin and colicin [Acidobacteriaceae bacterium]
MRKSVALATVLQAVLCTVVSAQINTGKISGYVTDSTGAALFETSIIAKNDATGLVTTGTSTETGEYLVNFLLPGTYHVAIEKTGFQRLVQTEVVVNAGGITRIDVQLRLGSIQQAVEVVSNSIEVETNTSELSQNFSHKQIDNLPNIDRNPLFQMNLMPGANNDVGSGNYGSNGAEDGSAIGQTRPQLASIGGVDANANTIYVEGIYNREPQNAYIGITPPIEGIQEVQVYTGKYNAEFGFSGSAVVNIVTKSGGNDLHGAIFEYLRNGATDAAAYNFTGSNQPLPKTLFQRNQFGAALGGHIIKDKLFFFGDYQGTIFHKNVPNITTVPTTKMMAGDFSELYNPSLGLDSAGNTYGQLYDPHSRQFDSQGNVISATPYAGNIIDPSVWDPAAKAMNAAHIFGTPNLPGISNNLLYLGRNRQTAHQGDGRLDFARTSRDRIFYRYSMLDAVSDNSTNINEFFQDGNTDSKTLNQNMQLSDLFSLSATKMNELRLGYSRTNVKTSNKSLGQDWNNLFGIPNGNLETAATRGLAEINLSPLHSISQPDWVGYIVSNTISVTDNFTLIKGHHNIKFGTNLNHIEDTSADTIGGDNPRGALTFDPAMTSYDGKNVNPYAYPSFLLGTMTSSARGHFVGPAPYQTYWQNAWYAQDDFKVSPSLTLNLGLRYELVSRPIEHSNRESNWDTRTNQLVVASSSNRSPGLGLDKNDWGPRVGFAWSPDRGKTSLRGGYGISYWMAYWSGPLTVLGLTYPNYAKEAFVTPNSLTPSLQLSTNGIPLANAQYDSSGKLILPANAVIRGADYNWKNQRVDQATLNLEREIRPGLIVDIGYLDVRGLHNNHSRNINQAPPQPANVDYNLSRPLYGQYPQLGDIPVSFSQASTNYDAVTARVTGYVNKYIFVNASYAHGRSFSNGNNLDLSNINQYYGPTQQDIAHIFNSEMIFALPVGRGQPVLGSVSRLVNAFVGGWQYSGLVHIRSGTRFDVTSQSQSLNNGQTNRADRVGNGEISNPTIHHWFNTAAYVDHTQPLTYGTAGINQLHADDQVQLDSSISKYFRITERQQVEFRADLFNTFNHPDFNAPDSLVGSATEGQVFSTSVDPRRLQFALKYSF